MDVMTIPKSKKKQKLMKIMYYYILKRPGEDTY